MRIRSTHRGDTASAVANFNALVRDATMMNELFLLRERRPPEVHDMRRSTVKRFMMAPRGSYDDVRRWRYHALT